MTDFMQLDTQQMSQNKSEKTQRSHDHAVETIKSSGKLIRHNVKLRDVDKVIETWRKKVNREMILPSLHMEIHVHGKTADLELVATE